MTAFEDEFLGHYLRLGLGSLPKSDIDALVMALLEKYGINGSGPLAQMSNQAVSEILRTPVSRIKRLRYEAALKFGADIEDEAKGRLLAAIGNATIESETSKICLIIEDSLAKNWLQGKLKDSKQIFDHSFNTELLRVPAEGLFQVLEKIYDPQQLVELRAGYSKAVNKIENGKRADFFRGVALKFAQGAGKAAGATVFGIVKAHLGLA